jgi:hypothetical protein
MKKEILLEINRFREIIGLKIIKESWIDDLIRKVIPDFDTALTKTATDPSLTSVTTKLEADASNSLLKTANGKSIDDLASLKNAIESDDLSDETLELILKRFVENDSALSSKLTDEIINSSPGLQQIQNSINKIDISGLNSEGLMKIKSGLERKLDNLTFDNGQKLPDDVVKKFKDDISEKFGTAEAKVKRTEKVQTTTNIDNIIDELQTRTDVQNGIKGLIRKGKYGEFKSRLNKLENLLQDEEKLKKLLGDVDYDKYIRELEDFRGMSKNIFQRLGIRGYDFAQKHPWWSAIIVLAVVSYLNKQLNLIDAGVAPRIAKLISDAWSGFTGGEKEYGMSLDEFKKFLEDNKLSSSDAKNDTEGSGFWKAGGKNYEYIKDKKTYIEDK